MIWYAIASLTPAVLLAVACLHGGLWPLAAVVSITVVVFFADRLSKVLPRLDTNGRGLSLCLGLVHLALLGLAVWSLGAAEYLSTLDKVLIFTAAGLFFGQVSNANAHELIHAAPRLPRRLGALVYITLLHGHHVSAHLRVHHVYAATALDPNSARLGEGFWAFAKRVLLGEFSAGFKAEQKHRTRASTPLPVWQHPYLWYVLGGILTVSIAYLIAGWAGIAAHLGIAIYAQLQLLLSDYVQHYGLQREISETGKPAPIGPEHSWNAPKWYSSAMMLNAPRHSDHHLRPAQPYPALAMTPETMPILPHSLPVMAMLALYPPVWHRVMDRRVKRWQKAA